MILRWKGGMGRIRGKREMVMMHFLLKIANKKDGECELCSHMISWLLVALGINYLT